MPHGESLMKEQEAAFPDGLPDERTSVVGGLVGDRRHRGGKDGDTASHPGQSCPQMPRSLLQNVRAKQSMKVYKRGKSKPRPEHSRSKLRERNKTAAMMRETSQTHRHMNGVAPAPMTTQFGGTRQHLRVTIHEARKLIAKDMNGYSDPFVHVELEGQHTRTRVVASSLNPRWEQVVHLMLPQTLDRHCDKLKLTVLDYDGPLLHPKFLGRVEIPVADVRHAWKQGNSFSNKWYKLLGNRRTKQSDRGELCLSLSFVDSHELSDSANQFLGTDKSESLKDADLNEWKLRVRVHHARAFDASPQDIEEFDTFREHFYAVTVRLGSLERKTSFSQGNLSVVQEGEEQRGMSLHVPWEETFDIPLEEATKTLKLDARINNQIMQLGNLIGLDGKFYDARKAMTNTDDVRFLISRVSKQDLPPNNLPPDNGRINGVGQFPLSAVFAFSTDLEEDLCDLRVAEANDAVGSSDKTEQQQQQQRGSTASRASPSKIPEELPDGAPGDQGSKGRAFMPRWQSFVNKTGKALEERVGWTHLHRSPAASTVSEDGSDSDTESSSSDDNDDGVETGPVAQQVWIPIGGRNGAITAELLVSLIFVKGGPASESGPGAGTQKVQQKEDFDEWLNDLVEPAGDDPEETAEPMAPVPPPLKDATFEDEELDIPLHKLFYMQVNQGSKFNKLRRFEQEIRDLEVQDWQDAEGGVKAQNSSFVMKLPPNKIGPNEAYTEVEMVVETLSKSGYILRQTIKNPEITFGDTFYTMVQTVAIPVSPSRTRLQVSFASEFVKSCIFKSAIQRASLAGAQKGCGKELDIIKRLISGDEDEPGFQRLESSSNKEGMGTRDIGPHGADAGHLFGPGWVVSLLVALLVEAIGVLALLVWNIQKGIALQIESQALQGRLMERMIDVLDHLSSEYGSDKHQDINPSQYQEHY